MKAKIKILSVILLTVMLLSSCVLDRANVQSVSKYKMLPAFMADTIYKTAAAPGFFPKRIDSIYYSGHVYSYVVHTPAHYSGVYYRVKYYRANPAKCQERVAAIPAEKNMIKIE